MSESTCPERRRFLQGLLVSVSALATPGRSSATPEALSESAQVVGRAYLDQTPGERDPDVLMAALAQDHPEAVPQIPPRPRDADLERATDNRGDEGHRGSGGDQPP